MEKMISEKYTYPLHALTKLLFLSNESQSPEVLPQMPSHQIHYFLNHAFEKQESVIIQVNKIKHVQKLNECEGRVRYDPEKQTPIVVESLKDNTVFMISSSHIRHIRLS